MLRAFFFLFTFSHLDMYLTFLMDSLCKVRSKEIISEFFGHIPPGSPATVNMRMEGAFCWLVPWIQTIKRQAGNPICLPRCWTHHLSFLLSHARQKACIVHMLHLDGCSRLRTRRRSQRVNVRKRVRADFPYFTLHICIPCVYVYPVCFSSVSDHFRQED